MDIVLSSADVEKIIWALREADADLLGVEQRHAKLQFPDKHECSAAMASRDSLNAAHKILTGKPIED